MLFVDCVVVVVSSVFRGVVAPSVAVVALFIVVDSPVTVARDGVVVNPTGFTIVSCVVIAACVV